MPIPEVPLEQILMQLVQQSSQPSLLISTSSNRILETNTLCLKLLELNKHELGSGIFYAQLTYKANQLIQKGLDFFNYEIFFNNKIFLILAEIRDDFLIVHLQEKFNYNMPSSHLINILDSLGAYIYCKDTHYRFTYANKMVGQLFGVDHRSIIGNFDHDYFSEPSVQRIRSDADRLVIEEHQEIEKEERLRISKNDLVKTFLSVKKPLFGKENEVVGLFGISTDISHYKAIEKRIRLNEQKLNTILDNVPAYIYIKDTHLNFTYVNKMTIELFNLTEDEIIGNSTDDLFGEIAGKEFRLSDESLFINKKVISGIEKLPSKNGDLFYWTVKAPLFDEDNNLTALIGMSTDISEQKKLEQALEKTNCELQHKIDEITKLQATLWEQATQDPLTKLFNRRYFSGVFKKEILKSDRSGSHLALLLIDADHFKKVNDLFGHDVGDKVLIKLAEIMLDKCRESDTVCRYGGEEFVILISEIDQETALKRAESIRLSYQEIITKMLNGHESTLSIGLAMWSKDLVDLEGLTKAADQAMYLAKSSGRNQVCTYK